MQCSFLPGKRARGKSMGLCLDVGFVRFLGAPDNGSRFQAEKGYTLEVAFGESVQRKTSLNRGSEIWPPYPKKYTYTEIC